MAAMAAMAKGAKPRAAGAGGARRVTVRPVRGEAERARWDALMRDHHYLGFRGMIGNSLRHVAERPDGAWVALLGWRAGAHKLAARDKWIGWTAEQRSRRLHLIANNVRFVILPGCSEPNLASRVLGRSLRRLSDDMRAAHGHPVLLAETFVDPARFAGTSYRAANWEAVGLSKGYERVSGGGYREHGRPKTILVRELSRDARALLRGRGGRSGEGAARRRRRRRRRSSRFGCAACTTICGGCRTSGGAAVCATSWRRCWRSPWRRSCAARRGCADGRVREAPEPAPAGGRARLDSGGRAAPDGRRGRRRSSGCCRRSTATRWTGRCATGRRPIATPKAPWRSTASACAGPPGKWTATRTAI